MSESAPVPVQDGSPADEREGSILDAFVELADSLVAHYDPLEFLYHLLERSLPLTRAAAGAVLLHYEGSLHVVASSDEDAEAVGVFEVQNLHGPARDAFESGTIVRAASIEDAADRWPDFVTLAAPFGWSSTFAVPLRLREHIAGSLVVFWAKGGHDRPDASDAKVLRAFADVATIAVLQQRETADLKTVNRQLHLALENRIKIEQAKGMVAQATGAGLGHAFRVIRHHARSRNERISEVAAAITSGALDHRALSGP